MARPWGDGRSERLQAAAAARTIVEHGESPAPAALGRGETGRGAERAVAAAHRRVRGHLLRHRIPYRLVADTPKLPVKKLIALPIEIQILIDRGQLRNVCGIVTEARVDDFDGRLAIF